MVRVVWDDPQTPSKDLRGHLAADGVAVHGCAGEAFSARTPQTGWPEVRRTACGVSFFFFASYAWRQKKEAFLEKHLRPTGTFDGGAVWLVQELGIQLKLRVAWIQQQQ